MKSIVQFMNEVRVELSRMEWPNQKEWLGATIVTLLLVLVASIFLGIVDRTFSLMIRQIFNFIA